MYTDMNTQGTDIFDPTARYFEKTIGCANIADQINCFTQNYTNAINKLCEIIRNINNYVLEDFCTKYSNISLKPKEQDIVEFGQIAEYCKTMYDQTQNNMYGKLIIELNNVIELFENWIMIEGKMVKCFNEYFENLDELEGQKFFNSIRHKYASNKKFQDMIKYYACTHIVAKPEIKNDKCVLKIKAVNNDFGLSRILSIDLSRCAWKFSRYAGIIKQSFNRIKIRSFTSCVQN